MKYVAGAVAESGCYIPVIGFLSYSVVSQKEVLETYADGQPVQGGLVYYGNPDLQPIGLDQNHTHFVMIDDGTVGKFGGEIGSKASIENSVAEGLSLGKFGSESPISTVLLAIQGGPGTVKTVLECLKQGTPCVIVNGSGKASNLIAYAHGLPLPGERPTSNGHTLEGLEELIMNEFECHQTDGLFDSMKKVCMECMKYVLLCGVYGDLLSLPWSSKDHAVYTEKGVLVLMYSCGSLGCPGIASTFTSTRWTSPGRATRSLTCRWMSRCCRPCWTTTRNSGRGTRTPHCMLQWPAYLALRV